MTRRLRRALDQRPAKVTNWANAVRAARQRRQCQTLSIRAALEWAFGAECASLDFAEDKGDNARPGVSPLWTVLQRGQLGCKVDGGGWNPPAADADIIASAVANLPEAVGGRPMAIRIASLARAGQTPDWGRDLKPRCIPVGWKCENQHGPQAVTQVLTPRESGFHKHELTYRGRKQAFEVRACPVTFTASAATIAQARKSYQDWCEALAWLALDLRAKRILDRITITAVLPDPEPWVTADQIRKVG